MRGLHSLQTCSNLFYLYSELSVSCVALTLECRPSVSPVRRRTLGFRKPSRADTLLFRLGSLGKGVQTGRPGVALGEEHTASCISRAQGVEVRGGETRGQNHCPISAWPPCAATF